MSRAILVILLALTGCTRTIPQPATLVADDSEALFDTLAGVQLVRRTFNFTNTGDEKTTALTVELRGDIGHFDIEWDNCSGVVLDGHATCQVGARLLPISDGSFDGELHVYGAAPVSASVLMHGKVMPASLSLTPMTSESIDAIQGQTVKLAFVLSNEGGVATGPMRITGGNAPFDSRTANCDGVALVGGASCVLTLSRTVAVDAPLGSATGALDVTATPGGTQHAAPELTVHAGGVLIVDSKDWGATPTLHEVDKVLTVTNPGPLTAEPVTVTVVSNEMYSPFGIISDSCKVLTNGLASGKSCQVTVRAYLVDTNQHTAALTAAAGNVKTGSGAMTALGLRAHWTVLLTFAGTGVGQVSYNGQAFSSGGAQFMFANGMSSMPFTVVAGAGSTFGGWTGSAPCTGTGACSFVGADNSDLTLVANFNR